MALTLDEIRNLPSRRRFAAMYGGGGGQDDGTSLGYLSDDDKQSGLAALARTTLNTADAVSTFLDTPGALLRGALAGKPTSGLSFDSKDRVGGAELLTQYGLLNKDANPYFRYLAGLAAEVALDPLLPITGPLRTLGIGGKAAKAAGIIGDAPLAALAKMGGGSLQKGAEAARKTWTGRQGYQFLGDLLPSTTRLAGKGSVPASMLTPDNLRIRPLVGQRAAQAGVTLEETIKASQDPNAFKKVSDYLEQKGIDYDSVKGETLGGALGFDYFGLHTPVVFNPKAAAPVLDALDAAGQALRWSYPARFASSLTNKKVGGEVDAAEQFFRMRHSDALADEAAKSRVAAGLNANLVSSVRLNDNAKRLLGAESLNSEQGMRFLTRMYEGAQTVSDMGLRQAIGPDAVDSIVRNWDELRTGIRDSAAALGMKAQKRRDLYGLGWSPRAAKEADFGEYGTGLSRNVYTTLTLENEARKRYLMTPGGTVDIQELSVLPEVERFIQEGDASGLSIEQVGRKIKEYIDKKHGPGAADPRVTPFKTFVPVVDAQGKAVTRPVVDAAGNPVLNKQGVPIQKTVIDPTQVITQRQGERIAGFLKRKDQSLPPGTRMFSESPLVRQEAALEAQGRARVNSREIYRSMGEAAIFAGAGSRAASLPGARLKSLDQALNDIAKSTGLTMNYTDGVASKAVRENVQKSIAQLQGLPDWTKVNLSEYALPESVYNRLTRINDFYSSPRTQSLVAEMFDGITNVFKGFALAFPATKIRDIYSNTFLVWMEAGNPADVVYGFRAAKSVLAGDYDNAAQLLRELPGYNLASTQAVKGKMVEDVSRTGILKSLSANDLFTSNRTGELNQLVPGTTPMRRFDFVRDLTPDGTRSASQVLREQFNIRGVRLPFQKYPASQTTNAMLMASETASNYSDMVARLGGMFALMRQGVSADEAAKRMTAALVDYSSLTLFERNVMRRLLPWYAYTSRSAQHIVSQLLSQPGGKYAQALRASRLAGESDEDTYVPEALRQQLAIRVPDALKPYLGIPQDARTTTFFKDFDIPGIDTLNLYGRAPTIYRTMQSTASNLAQQAHPMIRSLHELTTGQDSFSRRPLDQAVTPLDRLYRRATGYTTSMNPLVRMAINTIPGPHQRLISIAGGLADDRIPLQQRIAKQAFNTLAGIKLQDVDPEWQLQDARRQLEGRLSGYMQDYTESYVPKDVLPQVPQELMPDYLLFRTLGKELRERRKQRQQ